MSKTKILSMVVICLVLFSVIFMTAKAKKADVAYYTKKENAKETVLQENEHLYYSDKTAKEMTRITGSEMTRLYFDKDTGSIAVYDTASKKLWRSLPEFYGGIKTAAVVLEIISDGTVCSLYSQGDSTYSYETVENGLQITYSFNTVLENKTEVKITVPVSFTLKNGTLKAEIDCSEIINESKKAVIKSISLLPFFGADREEAEGDYLLIPDGSGLTVDLSENPENFSEIDIPVYGEDLSVVEDSGKKAVMGAFGMKKGNSALVALIEDGAEFARIKAKKALSKEGLNSVGAYFEITPTGENDNKLAVSKKTYDGIISLSYRFLSFQNADYIGMASAVRELLIRNGSFPMTTQQAEGDYPFFLSIIGVGYDKNEEQSRIFTSYSQTFDILSTLKAKGVSGINLRHRGLFEGGVNQRDFKTATLALGDSKDLYELTNFVKTQGISLFADVKLISSSVKESFDSKAMSFSGEYTRKKASAFEAYPDNYLSPDKIKNANASMLSKLRELPFDGVCFADAGKYLYSNFTKGNVILRNGTANTLKEELNSVSANKNLMVDTGNLYSVKYASAVINLPGSAYYKGMENCSLVPFVEAVYHGLFDYALTPINTAKVSDTMFLRSVEYGAVPSFEWYYADNSTEKSKDKYCYNNSINEAQIYYQRMSSLADLRNARITAHEKVKKNVYMTEYDGSTKVYVNYNSKAVTVSGVTIEPRSFVRVN